VKAATTTERQKDFTTETVRQGEASGLSERIIGLAIEVHRQLGPGLLESAYEQCLCHELGLNGFAHARQVPLPIIYKGVHLECGYRMDIVVEQQVVIEVKAIEKLMPIHEAQMLTYLRLSGFAVGLLMNFNNPVLKTGLRRLIHK
jgi:GxxExxY protein